MNTYLEVAKAVQSACLNAARIGFENARMDGLCCDGAIEVALDAIRGLELENIVQELAVVSAHNEEAH